MCWEGHGLAEDQRGGKETGLHVGEEHSALEVFHHVGAGNGRELYEVGRGCRAVGIRRQNRVHNAVSKP